MKYTQLLMDKSKEELAMLCMDKHRQVKRLKEENAKLRHDIDRAIANHSADLTGEATENARLTEENAKLRKSISKCAATHKRTT